MKKWLIGAFLALVTVAFIMPDVCLCEEMSNYELMEELKALKEKTKMLEDRLNKQEKVETKEGTAEKGDKFHGGAEGKAGIPERVRKIEGKKGCIGKMG